MVNVSRRDFIKGVIGVAAAGALLAGQIPTIERFARRGYITIEPDPTMGKIRYVYSVCLGCNVRCGIRVRVVERDGAEVVERIEGNPYHLYNRVVDPNNQYSRLDLLPYNTPVRESLKYSGTLCPRGIDGIHYLYDPLRIVKPLKRAGPRGSGKWKVISWDQLVKEIADGGVLEETGEKIPGLKEIFVYGMLRDAGVEDPNALLTEMRNDISKLVSDAPKLAYEQLVNTIEEFKRKWSERLAKYGLRLDQILVNPDLPDLGFKSNQFVYVRGRGQSQADEFYQRFVYAFGSVNWLRHTSSCQLGFYAGNKLWSGATDVNADVRGAKVLIMAGAQMGRSHPGATGQGILIERAARGELKVFYVNPIAPRINAGGNIEWVPIKPGTDAALAMAMIRWIIENKRYNKGYLEIPNEKAALDKGEVTYTNATWLVITEPGHQKEGTFLRASDVGLGDDKTYVVYAGGELKPNTAVDAADLFYKGRVKLVTGEEVEVKTVLQILYEEASSRTLEEWSSICGVPVETIIRMADAFTSVGRAAATYIHRGVGMQPNGEYNIWAYRALDMLIGNFHAKGGLMARASITRANDYLYNVYISGFGEPPRYGPPIDRHGARYESTLEYWLKVKKGENRYPAKRPWYPHTPEEIYTELFAGIAEGYPYPVHALFLYYANPVLAANSGVKFAEVLKDTRKLPLFVCITTTINESCLYADYIVPDTTYLETGTMGALYLYASSAGVSHAEAWRSPAVMPLTEMIGRDPVGRPRYASMWELLIDLGKKLGMPGYGDKAFPGVKGKKYEGQWFPLHSVWDYIMRVYANAAMHAVDLGLIPKEVPEDDVKFVEENYPIARFKDIIPEEWPYVAYGLARGGIFTSYEKSYDERGFVKRTPPRRVLYLWNEDLAKTVNSVTGKKFYGGPKYFELATYDGRPLREVLRLSSFWVVPYNGPLYTKHRSQMYYYIKMISPENYAIMHPDDAAKLGVKTGDIMRLKNPYGYVEVPVVVEPTVARGVIGMPTAMGRWAETLVQKPKYFKLEGEQQKIIDEIPEKAEVPGDAYDTTTSLPEKVKRVLFPRLEELTIEWRFNGVTINMIGLQDPSTGNWSLLTHIGGGQVYNTLVEVEKTGLRKDLNPVQLKI